MTEYTVVLFFGVMTLTTGPMSDVLQDLINVMKENYEGYSFAISMSEAPDYDNVLDYRAALVSEGLDNAEIDKLAVDSADLYQDMTTYNKDPLRQLTKGINRLKNCINSFPTSISQVQNNKISC